MTWQPIETAPKDGTEILMRFVGRRPYVTGVKWHVGCFVQLSDYSPTAVKEATHWMPIPTGPTAAEIEAIRAKLVESRLLLSEETARANHPAEQLLAAQVHPARLLRVLEELSLYVAYNGDTWVKNKALSALSAHINLDALHEDRAQVVEALGNRIGAEEGTVDIGSVRVWLREEAAAHRAKKTAAMAASREGA